MRIRTVTFAIPSLLFGLACGGGGGATGGNTGGGGVTNPGGGNTGGGGSTAPVATNAVTVSDNQFAPPNITVSKGTTVTWTWAGGTAHNVTFDDAQSGDKTTGTFSKAFATAGTFTYRCTLHAGMTGSVEVH